jgi:ABC-type phosphate/phosphonate transport system substrate-binding protein
MGPSRARPRALIAESAAIAATLVLLSGCGSSSSSSSASSAPATSSSTSQATQTAGQFKAAIAPVLNQFKSASQATGTELEHAGSQTDAQIAAAFQQPTAKWTSAVTKLETLHPPPQLTAAYNRLKSQVSKVNTDLAAIVSAAQNHDATAAKDARPSSSTTS